MFGKYSPTVDKAYDEDQEWFDKNCENEGDQYDKDGYDSYGYNRDGYDRIGKTENDWLTEYINCDIKHDGDRYPDVWISGKLENTIVSIN